MYNRRSGDFHLHLRSSEWGKYKEVQIHGEIDLSKHVEPWENHGDVLRALAVWCIWSAIYTDLFTAGWSAQKVVIVREAYHIIMMIF